MVRRIATRRFFVGCLVILVLGVVIGPASQTFAQAPGPLATRGDGAKPAATAPVLVSPQPGELVRAYPFTLQVRALDGADELRAWLNGVAIGSDFGQGTTCYGCGCGDTTAGG